jgi:LacI family transcriptional regulator
VHPGLTTVAVPLAALGERAVAAALGDEADGASVELPTRVVLRASTPPRAAPPA